MDRPNTKAIEIVIQPDDDGASIVFDHAGSVHVAADADALGRWVVDIAADPRTPAVTFGKGSRWLELARRALEAQGLESGPPESECVAVHVLVQLAVDNDGALVSAAAHPPVGKLRAATTAEKLGAILDTIARDENQPRVPPGSPPDALASLAESALRLVTQA